MDYMDKVDQRNFGQTKVDEDKDTVDYQTMEGKQRCKKRRTWRMDFLYPVLILGQKGILALILGILQ